MNSTLFRVFVLFLHIVTIFISCSKKQDKVPSNILFIFADDLTYRAIHALGNKEIHTPYIDKLIQNGTTFTHSYNMGGWHGAICTASRSMLISGMSLWDAGKIKDAWLRGEKINHTWGKWMQQAGYDTYMTGKWHVLAKADSVFNYTAHIRPGMPPDLWTDDLFPKARKIEKEGGNLADIAPIGYNRPLDKGDSIWKPYDKKFGGFWSGGKHWSEVLTDDATIFLNQAKRRKKPFFMYLSFNASHDPRQSPKHFVEMYPLDNLSLPKSFLPYYPYANFIGAGISTRDEALAPIPRTPLAIKKHKQEYYAIISHLDEQIGKILAVLEQNNLDKNTYIIFTADHGLAMGRHGMIGKQNLFDHSLRVPFVINGPNIPKNKKINADIYLQDAMATCLDIAGIKKPSSVYFNSIIDLIEGKRTKSYYDEIYGGYNRYQRMIRKDNYKLIVYPPIEKLLLFDMKKDSEEMIDISYKNHQKTKALFEELIKLQAKLNDTLDLKPLYKKIFKIE